MPRNVVWYTLKSMWVKSSLSTPVLMFQGTPEEWQKVFYVWAAIFVIGVILFAVFARGEIQDWAVEPEELEKIKQARRAEAAGEDTQDEKLTNSTV